MYTYNRALRLARALAPTRFAAGILVTMALLSAACGDSDPASRIISPPLLSSSSNSQSAAASNFAVLARTAVSCSGGSITGDVGTFQAPGDLPAGVVTLTEGCQVFGRIHVGNGVAKQAFNNFLAEYERLEALACDFTLTGTLNRTLTTPGVYCFDAGTTTTDGQLTLDGPANGIWIFKIGTLGTGALTGTNFDVVMTNGDPCNVTWWIAQAATMSTSDFQGNILAGAAISMTGGTFNGNAWAGASGVGDVTFTEGTVVTGCEGGRGNGNGKDKDKCNQGVGNGPEDCDPGNSNHRRGSNDENGGTPGNPGRKGGH